MRRQRKPNDLSRSLITLDMDTTLIAVVELSLSSWLVAGIVPGVERQPLKKLKTDENALLTLLNRWRDEAVRSGQKISRVAVAFEAGRDGFWLARWLNARGIEALGDMLIVPANTPHQVIPTGGAPIVLMTMHVPHPPTSWPPTN